eukprot:3383004-Lingulodinium_polyedra.AAC.1
MPLHVGPPEFFSVVDGEEFPGSAMLTCVLCSKTASNGHCRGKGHVAKLYGERSKVDANNMQWPKQYRHDTAEAEEYWKEYWKAASGGAGAWNDGSSGA